MLLFLIEQDTFNKGTVPPNRREFMLPPSPEMVLDGARQMHKVKPPGTPQELGHERCKIPSVLGKAEEEHDLPRLTGDMPGEGTPPSLAETPPTSMIP